MLVKYIEQNYPNKEFKADMISEVDKEYLEYAEYFTSGVYWIDSNPHQYAVETILSELKRKGLIKQKNSEDGSEILYVLA